MFREIRNDLPASIVVFFVAVPLCLGIALASGAPLFSGLIAGIVGGIVVGSISGSALGVSGPAAGLAVIVLGAIQSLGFETFLVAVVLGGVIQIILGIRKAGLIAHFFPSAVVKGMLAGIGVIIVMKQIPHALGHDSDPEGSLKYVQQDGETTISSFSAMLGDFEPSAIFVAAVALAILLVWERVLASRHRIFTLIQGPIVAVAFGIVFQVVMSAIAPSVALEPSHLVTVPVAASWGELTGLLTFPDWTQLANPAVYVTAVTMAVVASLETLLCVEATDKLDSQRRVTPTNQELIAQGTGNIVSGMMGGLPVTQVIVRSSANIQSGGKTKLSAILHGIFMLVTVVAIPQLLNLVPLAVLAAILLVVGYKLAKPALFREMYELGMHQFVPFVVTVGGIVFTDLLMGIGMGMAVAVFSILARNYQASHFLNMRESDEKDGKHHVSIKLVEEVTFLNKGAIVHALAEIPDHSDVVIDSSDTLHIDYDVLEVIDEFEESAPRRNITLRRIGPTLTANGNESASPEASPEPASPAP